MNFKLGTIHKRRRPNFLIFGVPSHPLSPHVAPGHTVTLSHIYSGYTSSEQPVQAPNSSVQCYLATPYWP